MQVARHHLVTEAEFLCLPESLDKVELVDGEVHVTPSPSFWHQEILCRLVFALRNWQKQYTGLVTIIQAPLDIRFGQGRILQPDAFVLLGSIPPDHQGPLDRVPEICIEVLSGNRVYDRVTKRFLYAAAGVEEYWIIDPNGVIEQWRGNGLGRVDELCDKIASTLLPGFDLDLRDLFENP